MQIDGYIADRVFMRPLLLELSKAETIASYLERRMLNATPPARIHNDGDDHFSESKKISWDAGSVRVIPIIGTLVHRGGFMNAASGILSYEQLHNEIVSAANDTGVKTILLDIDSGGGEVDGNFELCRLIREINDNYKPVVAIANGSAYSGAFSIGCAAGAFYVTETGGVGSVGVIIQHIDYSKANEMRGIKVTQITAGDNKGAMSPDFPLSKKAYQSLKGEIDRVRQIFVSHVAAMRDIPEKVVQDTEAALLFAENAVNMGFVDGIASFNSLLEGMMEMTETTNNNQGTSEMRNFLKRRMAEDKNRPEDDLEEDEDHLEDEKPEDDLEEDDEDNLEDEKPEDDLEEDEDHLEEDDEDNLEDEKPEDDLEEDETDRAAKIAAMCSKAGMSSRAAGFIRSGKSVKQVRRKINVDSQIKALCVLAKQPSRAAGFIRSGKSVKQVQNILIRDMSAKQPAISAKGNPKAISKAIKSDRNVILADVQRRKEKAKRK